MYLPKKIRMLKIASRIGMTLIGLRKIYDWQRHLQFDTIFNTFIKTKRTEIKLVHWSERTMIILKFLGLVWFGFSRKCITF